MDLVIKKDIESNMDQVEQNDIEIKVETEIKVEVEETKTVTMNLEDLPRLPTYQYVIIYITLILSFIALVIYTIFKLEPEKAEHFLNKKLFIYISIIFLTWANGKVLRKYFNLRVNYSRKVNHMCIWFIPFLADIIFIDTESNLSIMWNIFMVFLVQTLWMIPTREADCTGILQTSFSAVDRPEDRPNTLYWLAIQGVGVGISLIPFGILWNTWDISNLVIIPLIIVTFGDGLAEPIGIRFGKHKYKVRALGTDKIYTRSLEGSFMVYLAGFIAICATYSEFELYEFVLNLIIVPIAGTLLEAFSPHTLDNPVIIIGVSAIISLIHLPQEL